ncbi:MAG: hypothetical protein KAH77_08255, partial [Thiomargarita sp.]|nr:hypothetical protein [Thiomargarita sp.]
FDVILSPGDVFIFRVADVDGDGYWEIDQSLDPNNFKYTGLYNSIAYTGITGCGPDTDKGIQNSDTGLPGVATDACIDQHDILIPDATAYSALTQDLIEHARGFGHIEIFAEGILEGMTHEKMDRLINPQFAGQRAHEGQREILNQLGTSLWSWVDAATNYNGMRTATDAGNILSGTAFITTNNGLGIAINAEAFMDFRTNKNQHRIDNYPGDPAVIIHDENPLGAVGGVSPLGDYLYGFMPTTIENRWDESASSANTTWGPTIADGDDYNMAGRTECTTLSPPSDDLDAWDTAWSGPGFSSANSICEINEAIRAGGQSYSNFYFANAAIEQDQTTYSKLSSYYFLVFPTKYLVGESTSYYAQLEFESYIDVMVASLLSKSKIINHEIWNHEEIAGIPIAICIESPCIREYPLFIVKHGVSIFNIDQIKSFNDNSSPFTKGRIVLSCNVDNCNIPITHRGLNTYPFLGYTVELDQNGYLENWRSMSRLPVDRE